MGLLITIGSEDSVCTPTTEDEQPVWHGAYSAFNRFRKEIARAADGSYPPHLDEKYQHLDDDQYVLGAPYTLEDYPGLHDFLRHPDNEGEVSPEMCKLWARDLMKISEEVNQHSPLDSGHIASQGGHYKILMKLIRACNVCADSDQPLVFS